MTNPEPRFPTDLVVDVNDFRGCGWKEALAVETRHGYSGMWSGLSAAAKAAMEKGETRAGKVLWLLADVCSPMLKPQSINEPYHPMMVFDGKRSALPEDFTAADLEFFAAVIAEIDEPRLRGRISDILWLCKQPREAKHAMMAIDAFREVPLTRENWPAEGGECWARAASLATMMGKGARDRLNEIAAAAVQSCLSATSDDGYLAMWVADLILDYRLFGKDELLPLAEHIESLAREMKSSGDHHRCRDYFERAGRLFTLADDGDKTADMLVERAESWAIEADAHESGLVALSFYENAIQVYREIPRLKRPARAVDERITRLRAKLAESGDRAAGEMHAISSDEIDISAMVKAACAAVEGKPVLDALLAFANLYQVKEDSVRDTAAAAVRDHPLSHLFPATMMSRDGRVIAKRPGIGLVESGSEQAEAAIWHEMVRHHGMLVGLIAQAQIIPAFEVLLQEHRLRERDFVAIAAESPIVPPDRSELFGKALYLGYDRDFVAAIHLLAPQVEHMVRYHLKAAGAITTKLDQRGIETENGLSTLVELPEMKRVFGPDTTFELRAVFSDALGPNLRNQVAHGLLSLQATNSVFVLYAWWLCLRLVVNTFWNARQPGESEAEAEAET